MVTAYEETAVRPHASPTWTSWPVYWSAIWVGALSALTAVLIIGLAGTAFGLNLVGNQQINHWSKFHFGVVVYSVVGSFLAFVIGGWVAGKIAGILRSETAMLHGAIVWVLAVPLLLALATHGASGQMGGWYSGLSSPSPAAIAMQMPTNTMAVSSHEADAYAADTQQAKQARNSAIGAVTALLLGLVGSVIGGWMASGEPMTFTHHRHRNGMTTNAAAAGAHQRF